MEEEQGTRLIVTDMSDWNWQTPAEALQRLAAFEQLAGTSRLGRGKPLPAKHRLRILGDILHHLLPDGLEEVLPEPFETLSSRQKEYLAQLIWQARTALEKRRRDAPSTLLGCPSGTRATWANLLDRGWVPWQPEWRGVLRK